MAAREPSDFKSRDQYEKNYIREGLMQYVDHTGGMPILLVGLIHNHARPKDGKTYCSYIKFYTPDCPMGDIRMVTQHLMIEGISADYIKRFPYEKNGKGSKRKSACIYLAGYPYIYSYYGENRCGFRLAFAMFERPYYICGIDNHITKDDFIEKVMKRCFVPRISDYYKY